MVYSNYTSGLYPSYPYRRASIHSNQQPYQTDSAWTSRYPGSIFSQKPSDRKRVALTFDDVPDSLFAPIMLEIFTHYQVKATFFCLGKCVHQNPAILADLVREGHVVGNHTYDHVDITKISPEQVREQLQRTEDEIYRIAGVKTALFRPPFGFLNEESIRAVLSMGYKIVLWNVDSYDWMGLTGPTIVGRVISQTTPGAIVLMHNSCEGSIDAGTGTTQSLPYIIETLRAEGYDFTTVSALLNIQPYQEILPARR